MRAMKAVRRAIPGPSFAAPGLALLAVLAGLLLACPRPSGAVITGFTSASECGRCHQDLYESWRKTFHAQAVSNPAFFADLERLEITGGRGVRVMCLSCHSPTTSVTMDYSLTSPVSREGVTCDFCHTVSSVDLKAPGA